MSFHRLALWVITFSLVFHVSLVNLIQFDYSSGSHLLHSLKKSGSRLLQLFNCFSITSGTTHITTDWNLFCNQLVNDPGHLIIAFFE